MSDYKFKIQGLNLTTINQLIECSSEQKLGKKFIVFAEFKWLPKRLRIKNGEWHLQGFLVDRSVANPTFEVKFQSQVVTDCCGHDGKEIKNLHKNKSKGETKEVSLEMIMFSKKSTYSIPLILGLEQDNISSREHILL
jgi:hypothetical protein